MTPEGISPDTVYSSIQGQITAIQTQIAGFGPELRDIRTSVVQVSTQLTDMRDSMSDIRKTLNGDGGLNSKVTKLEIDVKKQQAVEETVAEMQSVEITKLKLETIKKIGGWAFKFGVVLLLAKMGYTELLLPALGIPVNAATPHVTTSIPVTTSTKTAN